MGDEVEEIDKKSYVKVLVISGIAVLLLLVIYYISMLIIWPYELEEDTHVAINDNLIVHIDVLEREGSKQLIAGYAYVKDQEIKTVNSTYILKNEETGKMYKTRCKREVNPNISKDYQRAGMRTRFFTSGLKSGRYDIYVLYKNNDSNILANTGIYIDI